MGNTVKERLKSFLRNENIKATDFCNAIGVSQGYIAGMRESIQPDKLKSIAIKYPNLDLGWLLTGEGDMLKGEKDNMLEPISDYETRPRIPYTAAAGRLSEALEGVTKEQCVMVPVVRSFPTYDFSIIVNGDSMLPEYKSGDEIACKRINDSRFIQWGRAHVLDTTQGIVIKCLYDDGDSIRCVSFNSLYPPFSIPKEEVYSISLVVGQLRL